MMSFFHNKDKKIKRKKASLRAYHNSLEEDEKKMSWNPLKKGSMTVEAALIMPIFIFAILNMLSIADIIRVHANIQMAMTETVREMAAYGYAYDRITEGETHDLAASIVGKEIAKSKVKEKAGITYLDHSTIKGGSGGIWFIRSDVMYQEDMIDLIARYRIHPLFSIAMWNDIFMVNRCKAHAWTGYDNVHKKHVNGEEAEQIVYIAEYGEVYHTTPACTHLKLSISPVDKNRISEKRNDYGEKFKKCEKCGNAKSMDVLYITNMGNRYHTSLSCSGLKRTIREVPLSQAGLPPCEKCG